MEVDSGKKSGEAMQASFASAGKTDSTNGSTMEQSQLDMSSAANHSAHLKQSSLHHSD